MYFGSFPAPVVGGGSSPDFTRPVGSCRRRAFTLVEMLTVISILLIVTLLIAPAFTQMNAARAITKASYDISGLLEEARAYAKANNTYTWVGFYEEASGQTAGTAGIGRVIVSVVASKNGTATYGSTDTNPAPLTTLTTSPSGTTYYNLIPLGGLVKIDNIHLTVLAPTPPSAVAPTASTTGEVPLRGKVPQPGSTSNPAVLENVPNSHQVGDDTQSVNTDQDGNFSTRSAVPNGTTFNYPLYAATPTYTFVKVIQFNPIGDATKIVDTPTQLIEIGLRPTHGAVIDTVSKNCAAVQVSGISGQVRIFRQ